MKTDRHYKCNCTNETMWCWYGNDWAKRNTVVWVRPWQSNASQKPKPSQTKGYAFLLLIYQIWSCCLRDEQRVKGRVWTPRDRGANKVISDTCVLLPPAWGSHAARAPGKSKELEVEEHFQGRLFAICLNEFSEVLGALHKLSAAGGPCSTDLQRAQFMLARDFARFSSLFERFRSLAKIFLRYIHSTFSQETRV